MSPEFLFTVLLLLSAVAGFVGSLTGLGGGVVLVPVYTLVLGVPIEYATGASFVSTIATSLDTSVAYVRDRITNVRVGMSLEVATSLGVLTGSLAVALIYSLGLQRLVYVVFGAVLLLSSYTQMKVLTKARRARPSPDLCTKRLRLYGRYYDALESREVEYYGVRWWLGALVMFSAGVVSGFLGIGGALKVLAMDWAMALPIKVSAATSNFMIGVTAATSSAVSWTHGYILPFLASATALGVLLGAFAGSRDLPRLKSRSVRLIFTAILIILCLQLILRRVWS